MKPIIYCLILAVLFAACKKNNDSTNCRVSKITTTYSNGSPTTTQTFEYNAQGRVSKLTTSGSPLTEAFNYTYYTDSVVVTTGDQRTVYFLNGAGLATRSHTQTVNSPIYLDDEYTYDADGYLIEDMNIFSQTYNGNLLHDTTYINFTIENGNIVKQQIIQHGTSSAVKFEYNASNNIGEESMVSFFHNQPASWLGKRSKNLMTKTLDNNGTPLSQFTYEISPAGRLLSMTQTGLQANPVTIKSNFEYSCN